MPTHSYRWRNRRLTRRMRRRGAYAAPVSAPQYSLSRALQPRLGSSQWNLTRIAKLTGGDEDTGDNMPNTKFQSNSIKIQRSPFSNHVFCDLTYCDYRYLFNSTGIDVFGTEQIYSLNSLFKPNFTTSGHQPYLFDQTNAVYRTYRVYSVSIEVTFTDVLIAALAAAVMPQASGDTYAIGGQSYMFVAEKTGAWTTPALNNLNSTNYTRYHFTTNIWDLEGMTYNEWLGNSTYSAQVSGTPASQPLIRMAVADLTSGLPSVSARVDVKIVYTCKLYDRITTVSS